MLTILARIFTSQFWPEFLLHNFGQNLAAHLVDFSSAFGHYLCLPRISFFFFFGTEGPDRMGLTAPSEYGIAKGQLIFFS